MFIRKNWLPLSVFLVAIVCIGLYLLATQPPPDPIIIYKPVEPLPKSEVKAPVGDTSQGGHIHADGTWHEGPHEAEAKAPPTAELQKSANGREPLSPVNISRPLEDVPLTADWNDPLLPFNATADEIAMERDKINILIEEHEAERNLQHAEMEAERAIIESGEKLTDEFAGRVLERRKRTDEFLRKSDILSKRLARVREVDAQQRSN